jgi:hypothetical protein
VSVAQARAALFTIADPHPDVFLVISIEKVLQASAAVRVRRAA